MLKTTGLCKVLALKAFRADENEIVDSAFGGKTDETVEKLSKFKKPKKIKNLPQSTKTKYLE